MIARILALALLLTPASQAVGGSYSKTARGKGTAQFLQLGAGARAMSLGEAYSALADEASAIYWNPAALSRIPRRSATIMHGAYIESTSYDFIAYAQKIGGKHALGLGLQYFSAGEITRTDAAGGDAGTFAPHDIAVLAGGAYRLDNGLVMGLTGKYIQSKIIAVAQTTAFDVGLHYPGLLRDKLNLAFVVQNIGGKLKFNEASESLPLVLKAGTAYSITSSWDAVIEEGMPNNDRPYTGLGTEYRVGLGTGHTLAGRMGVNTRTLGEVGGLSGVSMGFGLTVRSWAVDYAFIPVGELGLTHRLSLTWKLPGRQEVLPPERRAASSAGNPSPAVLPDSAQEPTKVDDAASPGSTTVPHPPPAAVPSAVEPATPVAPVPQMLESPADEGEGRPGGSR